jgi:hypothetical protein
MRNLSMSIFKQITAFVSLGHIILFFNLTWGLIYIVACFEYHRSLTPNKGCSFSALPYNDTTKIPMKVMSNSSLY